MTVLRSLFLLLVLVNLGLLAVFAWFVTEPAPRQAYDGPTITLLRELDPATMRRDNAPAALAPRTETAAAEAVAAGGADRADPGDAAASARDAEIAAADFGLAAPGPEAAGCISVGPFALPTEADVASEALTAEGFAPRRTTRETEVWDGYWVFIETIEGQAEARAIAADLAENGISDTQVIASSDRGTLLSIGVFSDIARAAAQADRVNDVGYAATIADSMRTTQTHWLDVEVTSEESIGLDTLAEPGRISRLEQRACVVDEATD
ncbi:MAG TPA: hypothetical protein VMR74_04720 [Gammaproteobacteria bacterium]|nr:hypothetical protein [Gammaproteobacteria bacterium]